jgi:hypothetical protein
MISKSFNRLLSCFLAIALVVGFVPISQAHAHESESEGVATPSAVVNTSGTTFPVYTLKKNVDDDQAMVLLIMGDGFTADEQETFLEAAKTRMDVLLKMEPYRSYANNINVYAMCVDSTASGVYSSWSPKDTYFGIDASTCTFRNDSFKQKAITLRTEVENSVLTSSSGSFKPTVSTTHIISNTNSANEVESYGFAYSDAEAGISVSAMSTQQQTLS